MTQETAEQNTINQLKTISEKEKTEELKSKPRHAETMKDHQYI
jgi:hypothetical protein